MAVIRYRTRNRLVSEFDISVENCGQPGGAAGIGVNFIPFVGQAVAVPAFFVTTAYFYLVAKLRGIGRK